MKTPATLHEMQLTAMTLRGLLRGLDDRGLCNDPREKDITAAMINAAAPLAERLADFLSELKETERAEKQFWDQVSQT